MFIVNWNDVGIEEYSYKDAKRIAKEMSLEYGDASIIREIMEFYDKYKVPTWTWEEFYKNGKIVNRTEIPRRYHDVKNEWVDIESWIEDYPKSLDRNLR